MSTLRAFTRSHPLLRRPQLLPRPRPAPIRPRIPPAIRHVSTAEIKRRLYSPAFWRTVVSEYRTAIKFTFIIQLGVLGAQASLHFALHRLEEEQRPTCSAWPWLARYYLRMSRLPNPWNPWGKPQRDADVKYYLDAALDAVDGREPPAGHVGNAEAWREELIRLRKARGEWYETHSKWTDAQREYEAALAVPLRAEGGRVAVAARLARILEWQAHAQGALDVLTAAQGWAAAGGDACVLDAKTEVAAYHARHGDLGRALELLGEVLIARRAAPRVADPREFTDAPGDPCKEAATMAGIGELMFAVGKRAEGVRWSEAAWERAWRDAEYRVACKECAGVAAGNLVKMGELMMKEAEEAEGGEKGKGKGKGWFWSTAGKKEEMREEAERLLVTYTQASANVEAVRAIRDAEIVKKRQR
ncbi:hypothetical protein EDC01DRAFT_755865 [Geopyxis carbonaria]|nr:hypothetical protein EDC01DRAFT_755865 [Geopyxis carbonaria]